MQGFQANLRPKPYTPRFYITRIGIAVNVVARLVLCSLQGAVACMLSYVGWAFAHTIFGKIFIPGLFQLPVHALAKILPASLIPYAGTILLSSAVAVIGFNFLQAAWSNMLTSKYMLPSHEDDHFPYAMLAFGLPMGLFAFGISNSLLSISTAFWLVFGISAAMGLNKMLVEPTVKEIELWQKQKLMHAQAEATYSQKAPTPLPATPAVNPPDIGMPAPTMTTAYNNAQSQQLSRSAPPIEIIEAPDNDVDNPSPNSP